jgi:hypothetical protein
MSLVSSYEGAAAGVAEENGVTYGNQRLRAAVRTIQN